MVLGKEAVGWVEMWERSELDFHVLLFHLINLRLHWMGRLRVAFLGFFFFFDVYCEIGFIFWVLFFQGDLLL